MFITLQKWYKEVPPYKTMLENPADDKETAGEKKEICPPVFVESKWDDYTSEVQHQCNPGETCN